MRELDARNRLYRMVAGGDFPTLDEADFEDLLLMCRVPDRFGVRPDLHTYWKPGRIYEEGQTVVPRYRNGHYYTVTVATGSAGDDEQPAFPTTSGASVSDVSGIEFTETGLTVWHETFDLPLAATEGWRRKAGRAASAYSFSAEGKFLNRSKIQQQCLEMAKQYAKKARPRAIVMGRRSNQEGVLIPGVTSNWDGEPWDDEVGGW